MLQNGKVASSRSSRTKSGSVAGRSVGAVDSNPVVNVEKRSPSARESAKESAKDTAKDSAKDSAKESPKGSAKEKKGFSSFY